MTVTYDKPSLRLQGKLDLVWPTMRAAASEIWESPNVCELYPDYLQTMHCVVRAGVPLMQAAIEAAIRLGINDPLRTPLIDYLSKHIEEERGHDEWLHQDYLATGAAQQDWGNQMPSTHVANLVGAQYYWIHHHHPVALLGHIGALESYHPPEGFAKKLGELTGYSMDAFRAIARHEKLDVVHKREFYQFINKLPLNKQIEQVIGLSGLHTMQCAIEVLKGISKQGFSKRSKPVQNA